MPVLSARPMDRSILTHNGAQEMCRVAGLSIPTQAGVLTFQSQQQSPYLPNLMDHWAALSPCGVGLQFIQLLGEYHHLPSLV
mmetsp:Transcript_60735/g.108363  ORF Transcript_60735/g.108363 Transcript_60735/m.108363 type:complete len:82 (+) Transcript_60735:223-468(+)